MTVEVQIPTILRGYTNDAKAVTVEADDASLGAVIDKLDSNHTGIKERLVQDGTLRRFVNVYVNDQDVRFLGGLDAPVGSGDVVVILPAVAGGS